MTDIIVRQMLAFKKAYKRLHANEKEEVNKAIHTIIKHPEIDREKKGDLAGVFVYKFKMNGQERLLAYEWDAKERILLVLGVHENYYRDLKR